MSTPANILYLVFMLVMQNDDDKHQIEIGVRKFKTNAKSTFSLHEVMATNIYVQILNLVSRFLRKGLSVNVSKSVTGTYNTINL